MYGAIIRDVAGSIYEVLEIEALKNKYKRTKKEREKIINSNVPLFTNMSSMTDDSVLTGAIAESYYGVLQYLIDEVNHYIPDNYKKIVDEFYLRYKCNNKNNDVKKHILKKKV